VLVKRRALRLKQVKLGALLFVLCVIIFYCDGYFKGSALSGFDSVKEKNGG
jgi:hypothetical protein